MAHRQLNDYVDINIDEESKEIIWGANSLCEIRIEFSFFWSLVKNLLSLTYIPAIVLLLESEKKIIIYILLAIVYIITLIFSDQKQTDKLLKYINKEDKRVSYRGLYYWGMKISIIFILFSVELVLGKIHELYSLIKFFFANYVIAFSLIVSVNLILSVFVMLITLLGGTPFYQRKWNYIKVFFVDIINLGMMILGIIFCCEIFNVKQYFMLDVPAQDKAWIILIILVFAMLKIITLIMDLVLKIKELKYKDF